MKTYAETQNRAPINWYEWIDDAIEHGPNFGEFEEMRGRADSWVTCACGNLCDVIPRDPNNGELIDFTLRGLGINFSGYIDEEKWESAKATLFAIEIRSSQLIAELTSEGKILHPDSK